MGKRIQGGFTLIELMLVVAIIGLLAAIAIPKFADLIDKSKEAANKGGLGSMRSAFTIYYADNEGLYPVNPSYLLGKYIGEYPRMYQTSRMPGFHLLSWAAGTGASGTLGQGLTPTLPSFLAYFSTVQFLDATLPADSTFTLIYRPAGYFHVGISCAHLDTRGVPYSTH